MKLRVINAVYAALSSARLTVFLLVYSVFLIFAATLAQREIGISAAQGQYFESFFCMAKVGMLKFPLMGGAAVGALAALNIILSGVRYARFGLTGFGVSITHMSLALLIISGALQYFMRTEGRIVLYVNMPTNSVSVANSTDSFVLPFKVRLKKFEERKWSGSEIAKEYSSDVVFERGEKSEEALISMNNPASFGGWTFYQMSYGRDGSSVLSAVKNPARLLPWLAVGATFAGMLIIFLPRAFGRGNGK